MRRELERQTIKGALIKSQEFRKKINNMIRGFLIEPQSSFIRSFGRTAPNRMIVQMSLTGEMHPFIRWNPSGNHIESILRDWIVFLQFPFFLCFLNSPHHVSSDPRICQKSISLFSRRSLFSIAPMDQDQARFQSACIR